LKTTTDRSPLFQTSTGTTGTSTQKHALHRTDSSGHFRLSDFFYKEIFGVHDIKQTDGMHQERVQNFLVVPPKLEMV
jgi:hypothetical protein